MSCTLIGLAVETLPLHRLPLVQARVPGGFPSPAEDYLEGTLKLDELLVKHPAATFLMRVEGRGEEIQMSGERFGRVKTSACIEARGIVENVEERLFILAAREKRVRRGIVLPECAEITNLPAANGLCGRFETGIWSEVVSDGPTADSGPIGGEIEPSQKLAGDRAVRRLG